MRRDCRLLKKKTQGQKQEEDFANAIVEGVQDALMLSVNSPIESWILDLGASFHSTSCKESLQNYVTGNFRKVYLSDDEPLEIVGKGDVQLKTANGTMWKLKNVRHIPDLKKNLISIDQLDDEGSVTTFVNGC